MKFRDFWNARPQVGEVVAGRFIRDIPCKKIKETISHGAPLSAFCAPPNCLADVHERVLQSLRVDDYPEDSMSPGVVSTINNWSQRKQFADGHVTSLYEATEEKKYIGDPVADSLAIVTRADSCIMALADGVSWGQKSKLASTCSVYGSVTYLNEHLSTCKNTKDVFHCILRAFEKAQQLIVSQQATMTTLCVGVVVPMEKQDRWALCVVNVGDSYAYVYNKSYGVKEVTELSHPIHEKRDMRQSGGALGPADGYNPDLGNLTFSYVTLEKDDLVFMCSDGVSDNFDPAISKCTEFLKIRHNSSFEEIHTLSKSNRQDSFFEEIDTPLNSNRNVSTSDSDDEGLPKTPVITIEDSEKDFLRNDELCQNCFNERLKQNNGKDIEIHDVVSAKPRRSKMWDFFPTISPEKPVKRVEFTSKNLASTKETTAGECQSCGEKTVLTFENKLTNDDSSRDQMFHTAPYKMSTSSSLDQIKSSVDDDDKNRLKSSSFSSADGDNKSRLSANIVHHEKDVAVSMLKQASSVAQLNSHPSIDDITGKKSKANVDTHDLTNRQRREGAIIKMTEIIQNVQPTDEDEGKFDAGEVCSQFINFVVSKTNDKRTVLEKTPQSELNRMTSKQRKEHNEKVKKEISGLSGKLDHASIACYTVGNHGGDSANCAMKLDRQKSAPAGNQHLNLNDNKARNDFDKRGNSADVRVTYTHHLGDNVSKITYADMLHSELTSI